LVVTSATPAKVLFAFGPGLELNPPMRMWGSIVSPLLLFLANGWRLFALVHGYGHA